MANPIEQKKNVEVSVPERSDSAPSFEDSKEREQISAEKEKQEGQTISQEKELSVRAPAAQVINEDVQIPAPKDEVLLTIERILSENLADAYVTMSSEKRIAFKKRGEEIALKIKQMADRGHLRVRSVLRWIRDWLRMIPGVNTFFLEQEAKIKTDRLMTYYKKQTGR